MSRKTIPFHIPQKPAAEPAPKSKPATELEQWVSQAEKPAPAALVAPVQGGDGTITITLSAMPNWFDLVRIGMLPYATAWMWTFGAAQRSFRGFIR